MSETRPESEREQSAIRNYPQLLRRYDRLLEVTYNLASTFDLNALLTQVVEAAQELSDCEATSLLLYDPKTRHMHFEAATNVLLDGLDRIVVPTDNSIAGWVFMHGEPLNVHDALSDSRFFREVDVLTRFQTRSVLGVPLRTKQKIIGVLEAVNKRTGSFTDEDVRLMQFLAAQAAIAIENSRLFQQSDLVSEMVHELRTPLSALTAAAHLLRRPDLPEDQRRKLSETVYGEVVRLNDMASDFLELARLESGRGKFVREPIHLGGLVQECLEIVRPLAEAEGVSLETGDDPPLTPVQGDRNRLKQVLLNLLTNAVKYNTRGGNVRVDLSAEGSEVIVAVSDTGHGIPADSLPHIFERFYRVPEREGMIAGTGLGLVIAKRIVEGLQGTLTVASQPGKGSTFFVRLPGGLSSASDTRPLR
ncbi:MAG TPA: ATP-binding protein [Anaerolineales bacterium]|nr:ATP-binding protein [Anaerolineales bacterium]